jgi:hypothetical protein
MYHMVEQTGKPVSLTEVNQPVFIIRTERIILSAVTGLCADSKPPTVINPAFPHAHRLTTMDAPISFPK